MQMSSTLFGWPVLIIPVKVSRQVQLGKSLIKMVAPLSMPKQFCYSNIKCYYFLYEGGGKNNFTTFPKLKELWGFIVVEC